jgi:hypothetical protein
MNIFESISGLENLSEVEMMSFDGGQDKPKGIVQGAFYALHWAVDTAVGAVQDIMASPGWTKGMEAASYF